MESMEVESEEEEGPSTSFSRKEPTPGTSKAGVGTEGAEGSGNHGGEGSTDPSVPVTPTFSSRTISVIASTMGITKISTEACQLLADELFYKTKELVHMSRLILHQNKSSTLTTQDVSKALKLLGGLEMYGHHNYEDLDFIYIPKADVYVQEDSVVDLMDIVASKITYSQLPNPCIQGQWIMPDNYSVENQPKKSPYYLQITKSIIMSGNPTQIKTALSDLRTNPKIGPECPYFLNFVALSVKKLPRDAHLTSALIGTVHAILHNRFVEPSPFLAVNRVANSLLKLVIESNTHKKYDDLPIRVRAGLLLAKVVTVWNIEFKQKVDIVRHLIQHLLDPGLPLQSHYGAIVALTAFGKKTLDVCFWPAIERYLSQLENKYGGETEIMVQHIMVAILMTARTYRKDTIQKEQLKKLFKVDQMLYAMFGDSVTPFRVMCPGPPLFPKKKRSEVVKKLKLRLAPTPIGRPVPRHSPHPFPPRRLSSFNRKLPPALYYTHPTHHKPVTFFVKRNLKFTVPRHLTSCSGDLLLAL